MSYREFYVPEKNSPFVPYYATDRGEAYLANTLEILRFVEDESVNLVLTSPPFALKRKKEYGNEEEDKYCDWFMSFAPHLRRMLKSDGSLVLDLGGAYKPGFPVRSIYWTLAKKSYFSVTRSALLSNFR